MQDFADKGRAATSRLAMLACADNERPNAAGVRTTPPAATVPMLPGHGMMLRSTFWVDKLQCDRQEMRLHLCGWRAMFTADADPKLRAWSRSRGWMTLDLNAERVDRVDEKVCLQFTVPLYRLATDIDVFDTFSMSLMLGGKGAGMPCHAWLESYRHRQGSYDFLPYVTVRGNLALTVVRRHRRRAAPAANTPRGVIFNMRENTRGGKTKAMLGLADALARAGASVSFVALQLSRSGPAFPFPSDVDFDYADAHHLSAPGEVSFDWKGAASQPSPRARAAVAQYLRHLDVDFVYLPNYDSDLYQFVHEHLPPSVLRILGDHNAHRYSDVFATSSLPTTVRNESFRRAMEQFDLVHVLLPPIERIYSNLTSTPIACIPNAISIRSEVEPTRYEQQRRIIVIARLTPSKQVDQAIEAFAIANGPARGYHLDIFGTGESQQELEALIEERQLRAHVTLRGFDADISARLTESALHVSASRFESFGLTLLEAMNAGVPVISYGGHPGADQLLGNGERGVVVEPANAQALGDAIAQTLDRLEAQDEGLRAQVLRAFEFSLTYGPEPIGARWMELLRQRIAAKRAVHS